MHRIYPVPCLNGSPAHCLVEQMMEVSRALDAACNAMRKWQPNKRDYQVGGEYNADREEYLRRLRLVKELAEQYESEAYSLSTMEV